MMERNEKYPWQCLTGNSLKIIACITMLTDHIGATLIANGVWQHWSLTQAEQAKWLSYYNLLRTIGRLAFPIFCFLLVEGFIYTRNWKKYALRLGIFALLSEVPFDLAIWGQPFYWGAQNVYFTLLIGILTLAGIRAAEKRFYRIGNMSPTAPVLILGIAAVGSVIASAAKTDYKFAGIILIVLFYVARQRGITGYLITAAWLFFTEASLLLFQIGGAAGILPVMLYNGKRGQWNLKYLFYIFYPLHLLALYLINRSFIMM